MNISKFLKVYLLVILSVTGVTAVYQNVPVANYYSSVLHIFENGKTGEAVAVEEATPFYPVSVEMVGNDDMPFIFPGQEKVKITDVNFESVESDVRINDLKLLIAGGEPSDISDAALLVNGAVVSTAKPFENHLDFRGVNYFLNAGESVSFSILISVNENSVPHDRIRLDIENSKDLNVSAESANVEFSADFPLRGRYVSIVGKK